MWYESCNIHAEFGPVKDLPSFLPSEHLGHPHLWTDDGTNLWFRNDFQVMAFQSLRFNEFLYNMPNLTHTVRQWSHARMRHSMPMKLMCYWRLFHIQSTKVSPEWIHLFIPSELGIRSQDVPSHCIWKAFHHVNLMVHTQLCIWLNNFPVLTFLKACLQCEFVDEMSTLTSVRTLSHISHR